MPDHRIVHEGLDGTDWSRLAPLYAELLGRELHDVGELEQLLLDRSELDSFVGGTKTGIYLAPQRDTADVAAREAYVRFLQEVEVEQQRVGFELDRKVITSPLADQLDPERFGVLLRDLRADTELYSDEGVALNAEVEASVTRYSEVTGAQTVEVDGEQLTLPAALVLQQGTDRDLRERAWRATAERRVADSAAIDEVFDQMIDLRNRMARAAGREDFVAYSFPHFHRFDYGPEECEEFQAAALEHCTPVLVAERQRRRENLGLERLEPWDLFVDIEGKPALAPFEDCAELVAGTSRIFHRLDPEIGAAFDHLEAKDCLDLESRPNKAAGGFMIEDEWAGLPFIFMNAAGTHRDVETILHEMGHCLHFRAAEWQPLLHYRIAGGEFSEFAAMSMELLTLPYLDEFYGPDDIERVKRLRYEQTAQMLGWLAQGDAFQFWAYRNPGHTRQERSQKWAELHHAYRPDCNWRGHEDYLACEWQRVPHFFGTPLYLINYVIAQLGALQLWARSLEDPARALADYERALALGGSRPLPELFQAAGCEFDFSPRRLGELLELARRELT